MSQEQWMEELRKYAATHAAGVLDFPSSWAGATIRDALDQEDFWCDRSAAGYTPQEALDEAIAEGQYQ